MTTANKTFSNSLNFTVATAVILVAVAAVVFAVAVLI